MAQSNTAFVVRTSLGDVKEEYLNRVDALLRDYRGLEERLAHVRAEILTATGLKGHRIAGMPQGNLPSDPTAAAVSHLEALRERELRLVDQVADVKFILAGADPEHLDLIRLFHNHKNRKPSMQDQRARLDLLTGWAYELYGEQIWADPH